MITLQFAAMSDAGSEAIKLFSRGWPSHVDAVIPEGLLGARSDTLAGVPPGVQIRPPGYEAFDRTLVVTLPCTPGQEAAFHAFLMAQIGKPYDKLAIAAFAVQRDWRMPDAWFCSELVAAALEACGWFPAPLANPANELTPRDLLLAVSPWGVVAREAAAA